MFNKVILSNQTMVCKKRILPGGNCILKVNNKSTNKNKVRNILKLRIILNAPLKQKTKNKQKNQIIMSYIEFQVNQI